MTPAINRNFNAAARICYRNRKYAMAMLLLFAAFTAYGFLNPGILYAEQQKIAGYLQDFTQDKGFLELAGLIILNNLKTALAGMVLGIGFSIFPIMAAIGNGYLLGAAMSRAYSLTGAQILLFVLPHGLFELVGLSIAFGLGVKMGMWFREKHKLQAIRKNFRESMLVYACIIAPLIIMAGLIESALVHLV